MERANLLRDARAGVLPSEVPEAKGALVGALLSANPAARPSAAAVSRAMRAGKPREASGASGALLQERDAEIAALRKQVEALHAQVAVD